jgi:hypothetical protein
MNTLPEHLSPSSVLSRVCVAWSLVLCVCFVDRGLSSYPSLGHCVVSPFNGFWLPLWYIFKLFLKVLSPYDNVYIMTKKKKTCNAYRSRLECSISLFEPRSGDSVKTGWLIIWIMCPSEATCLFVYCCFCELALYKSNSACWSSTKQTSSSFHWKSTYSRHEIAANCWVGVITIIHSPTQEENLIRIRNQPLTNICIVVSKRIIV